MGGGGGERKSDTRSSSPISLQFANFTDFDFDSHVSLQQYSWYFCKIGATFYFELQTGTLFIIRRNLLMLVFEHNFSLK